jgi:hypothetical protein
VLAAFAAALFLSGCTSPASDGHTDHQHTDEPSSLGHPPATTPTTSPSPST